MSDLGHALGLSALIAAALEYAILLRHRQDLHWERQSDELIRETGLRALVRVALIEDQVPAGKRHRRLQFRSHLFGRGPLLRRGVRLRRRTTPVWLARLSHTR